MERKGQAAAATLIAIIAGMIVLYILFVPPGERQEILGNSSGDGFGGNNDRFGGIGDDDGDRFLLNESPGRIDYLSQEEVIHSVPTTRIFTKTSGVLLEGVDSLHVERSLFNSEKGSIDFELDPSKSSNVKLSFNTQASNGRLIVLLNGEEIVNKRLESTNVGPIELPDRLLEENNTLRFKAGGIGLAFWRSNSHTLEDVKVTGDVRDVSSRESKSQFIVSDTEYNNLEEAEFKFQPDCDVDDVSPLNVLVNGVNVYSGVPDCGVGRLSIEFSPRHLREGENEVVFRTEEGEYFVSHISVVTNLDEIDYPTYYFSLSQEEFLDIEDGDKRVVAKVNFVEETEEAKNGRLIVNGDKTGFSVHNISWKTDISDDVVRGNNAVRIKPEDDSLDVRDLIVGLK